MAKLKQILVSAVFSALPLAGFTQADSVSAGRMLGNRGVDLSPGFNAPNIPSAPATGIGGVPAGYEEVSVPLPEPAAAISSATADVLRSIGYRFTDMTYADAWTLASRGICVGDFSGRVVYSTACPTGRTDLGDVCTPSTAYYWCGATGTATLLRKIETNGRVPTQLDTTAITSISAANGTVGVLDDATTLKKLCAMNGYVSVWSYLGYEYDPGGTFRRCGTRPTSYWTGTAWGMTNSCRAVGQLTCY